MQKWDERHDEGRWVGRPNRPPPPDDEAPLYVPPAKWEMPDWWLIPLVILFWVVVLGACALFPPLAFVVIVVFAWAALTGRSRGYQGTDRGGFDA